MRRFLTTAFGGTLAACLAACSGSNGIPALPGAAGTTAPASIRHTAAALFHFKIPHRPHHRRGARYLSPSTASIEVTAFDATHVHQLATAMLETTPGSGGCTAVLDGTFGCALSISVPPGAVTFDVASYDKAAGGGNKLSALDDFAFVVTKAAANHVAMTLGGVAASIDVALVGISAFATGSAVTGFQFGGIGPGAAQRMQLTARDADGNIIVNPGAPVLTLTSDAPSKLNIAPVAGSSGLFVLTPLAETNALPAPNPSTAITLTATATAAGTGAAPLKVTSTLQNDPVAYIGNYDSDVQAYAPWSSSPIVTITFLPGPDTTSIAIDASGNVYLANIAAGSISVFPPGIETPSRTITGLTSPMYLAVDAAGDIYANENGSDIVEFTLAGGNTPSRTLSSTTSPTGIHVPHAIAVDRAGYLYVNNVLPSPSIGVAIFAPGTSTTPSATFFDGMSQPEGLALDPSGAVYVSNFTGNNVTKYTPPFSTNTKVSVTLGDGNLTSPQDLTADGLGNVYVINGSGNGHVLEYASSAPTTLVRTFSNGSNTPYALGVDPLNDVYVPWSTGTSLDIFAPGSSAAAFDTLTTAVSFPYSVAIWP